MTMSAKPTSEARAEIAERLQTTFNRVLESRERITDRIARIDNSELLKLMEVVAEANVALSEPSAPADHIDQMADEFIGTREQVRAEFDGLAAPADAGDAMRIESFLLELAHGKTMRCDDLRIAAADLVPAARRLLDAPPVPRTVIAAYTECMEIAKPYAMDKTGAAYWIRSKIEAARARVIVGMQEGDAPPGVGERMREALKPFAQIAGCFSPGIPNDRRTDDYGTTVGMFRAAAAAILASSAGEGGK